MEELWQQTSELLWQRPLLWVPVLLADLLGFVAAIGSTAWMRAVVSHRIEYHSVLGGPAVRGQVSPAAVQHASLLATAISLPADFLRLVLYAAALVVTAAIVRAYRMREANPLIDVAPSLRRHVGSIFSLSLRALAIYGGVALVASWIGQSFVNHGHRAVLTGGWLDLGAGVVRVVLLAYLLAPIAVRVLAGRAPATKRRQVLQLFAFVLGMVAVLLGRYTTENMRAVHIASAPTRFVLELTASWIVALPYAVFFVSLAIVAMKTAAEGDFADAPAAR